ncbi:MAG TPA: NAD(P)-dependent oxidoreductase [Bacteroidales bacterium]|nr:NAD(P)-dependent oxidoreductase [Bacteroidales bacterium]HPI68796.1 NAD(P)-dependent oxidoreductase [Bacteroidales bacterium]HPR11753.1 NAD(P)-dependent oxidoreductase [Bacteroidales bacterium]HRW84099.1 NAD(P)-dependent oxidoreductase [Bacteroidales bacterium]
MKNKGRIVVLDTGYKSYETERSLLEENGYIFEIFPGERDDYLGKREFASDAAGLFVRWTRLDREFFSFTPMLRAVSRYGVGFDNINLEDASRSGIKVANVTDYANHSVSDHALALMFSLIRAIPQSAKALNSAYGKPGREDVFELHDKTLGIIGLGRIGGTFAIKAKTLFREVLAVDPYIPDSRFPECGARKVSLREMLEKSHVISIHCNLTPETRHIIDAKAFSMMKNSPVLINTSRGGTIDEEALKHALQNKLIHSAGLDVFRDEPPGDSMKEVLTHPDVIATGHNAWYSISSMSALQRRAATNLISLLNGEEVEDCLN